MVLSFFKEAPFTDVLWSAPCQQSTLVFSGKYDGSCLPLWPIGENVPGLIDHPDWPRVRELMKLLPYQVHVLCTKLETISPMARSRLFFLFSPSSSTPDWASLVLSPKDWLLELGIYHHFWKNQLFSLRNQKRMLSERSLLPVAQRVAAYNNCLMDGPQIIAKRKAVGVLPTLVASYRRQCDLPSKNLITKGILTWLVPGALKTTVFSTNLKRPDC